jgi:single-strand DNA-binding protein
MARSVNQVTLIGSLGSDPESKGKGVVKFRLATNKTILANGSPKELTEWHSVVTFGKTGEFVEKYVKKGCLVYVFGELRTSAWEDKSGNKRYTTEVAASNVQLLRSPSGVRNTQSTNVTQAPAPVENYPDDPNPEDFFDLEC